MPDNSSAHGFASNPPRARCRCRGLHRHVTWLYQLYIKRLSCGKATRKSVRVGRVARRQNSLSTPLGGASQISYTKPARAYRCLSKWLVGVLGFAFWQARRIPSRDNGIPGQRRPGRGRPGSDESVGLMGNGSDGQRTRRMDKQRVGWTMGWMSKPSIVRADRLGELGEQSG